MRLCHGCALVLLTACVSPGAFTDPFTSPAPAVAPRAIGERAESLVMPMPATVDVHPSDALEDDVRLEARVRRLLIDDPDVDAALVGIAALNGDVTLHGPVTTLLARRRAEAVARKTPGVRSVTNRLSVEAPVVPDATLGLELRDRLQPVAAGVEVRVHRGIVELDGEAGGWALRGVAEDIAMGTAGVIEVRSRVRVPDGKPQRLAIPLHVGPRGAGGLVAIDDTNDRRTVAAIREALAQHPALHGAAIEVRAKDGNVTLIGDVGSLEAVDLAFMLARSVPGVGSIRNVLGVRIDEAG